MSIFREYDIRGVFEKELHRDNVISIGYLLGERLKKNGEKSIAIGFDARVHSKILFSYLSAGLILNDIEVYNLGLIPTPAAYFTCFNSNIISSVMITGSHNPPEYNGFKITISKAPFYGKDIQQIAKDLGKLQNDGGLPSLESKGIDLDKILSFLDSKTNNLHNRLFNLTSMLKEYINFLSTEFKDLGNLKEEIAFDCGNGVAGEALLPILKNLSIKNISIFTDPDGTFPNHHPDPSEEKNLTDLKNLLKTKNIKVGIAFDGDADRVALISQNHIFKGDELAILFARDIATKIDNPIIIGEVKCSMNMYNEIDKIGKSVMYKTGHSNLKVKLKELNATLACEMSGHIFFNDRYFGYDDAIYAALRILELVKNSGIEKLESEIKNLPKLFSTDEEKVKTTEERKFKIIENLESKLRQIQNKHSAQNSFPEIKKIINIDGVRVIFENGWGLVRASNTTPVLVTRFEATSYELLQKYKNSLLSILED